MKAYRGKGIGGHTAANEGAFDTWLTPPAILQALGTFALDPCAAPSPQPWPTAAKHIELPEDGLAADWGNGRVWLNPPYGTTTGKWLERMAAHNRGTVLIFARTETDDWHRWIWPIASGILFLKGRLHFYLPDGTRAKGNAGGPSALVAYGWADAMILRNSGIAGAWVPQRMDLICPNFPADQPAPDQPRSSLHLPPEPAS
jgi:hypothetical protein